VDDDVGGGGSGGGSTSADWQNKQRKNAAKINLRQFFGATVKFQKNLRRCASKNLIPSYASLLTLNWSFFVFLQGVYTLLALSSMKTKC